MGILRSIFGPSKDEIWRLLAHEIHGTYSSEFWTGSKVRVVHKEWVITLDTYTQSHGKSATTYTRLRAPYVNADRFQFKIYRKGIFSGMAKFFGEQDIEIGDPAFDDAFIIQGNDSRHVRTFFQNPRIRQLLEHQPLVYLTVKDDEGWFGPEFPKGVDELCFTAPVVIKDVNQLKELFELFAETLNHLCHIGSAYENDPNIVL